MSFLKAKVEKVVNRGDKMTGVNAILKFFDDEGLYPDFHKYPFGTDLV
ncbi:MAG: hypothetical protein Q8Q05_02035 [bacterium]|nr:hypothetical protein [bacterium]